MSKAQFSLKYLDHAIRPQDDFYRFAVGGWIRNNSVPPDRATWSAFDEASEENFIRVRKLLDRARRAADRTGARPLERDLGRFYSSALGRARRNLLGSRPIKPILRRVESMRELREIAGLLSGLHDAGVEALFQPLVHPDHEHSRLYAFYLLSGGLSLPDCDYYSDDRFSNERRSFRAHVSRTLRLLGASHFAASRQASVVISMETELARRARKRVAIRDLAESYRRLSIAELGKIVPEFEWSSYLGRRGLRGCRFVTVDSLPFFLDVRNLLRSRSVEEWRAYLSWHVIRTFAPLLDEALDDEFFRFYRGRLFGQREAEPPWKRAARMVDRIAGQELGQLYVESSSGPKAIRETRRMLAELRHSLHIRLARLPWMERATRQLSLAKLRYLRVDVGHPRYPRDPKVQPFQAFDYFGNVLRANLAASRKRLRRVGRRVERGGWLMTPPTVNAYFDPARNEIALPAGILRPPFLDPKLDDAVNFGGLGVVIGHELSHGFDELGHRFDYQGNLKECWTSRDAREFRKRARRLVGQFDQFEATPRQNFQGELIAGETIADLGGLAVSFDALQGRLRDGIGTRATVGGFTDEQRFFIAYAQVWRQLARAAQARWSLATGSHPPGRFRVIGALRNFTPFHEAFGVRPGDGMWNAPSERVEFW